MPDEPSKKKEAAERSRKRTREHSSQTDEEDASDQHHEQGCKKCFETTNSRLSGIEEKLNMLLAILPELETYKNRINLLGEENKALQTSLEYSQAEIKDLKAIVDDVKSSKKQPTPPVNEWSANSKSYIADMLNSNVTFVEEI